MKAFILGFLDTIIFDVIFAFVMLKLLDSASIPQYRILVLILYIIIPFVIVAIHLHLKSIKNYLAYVGVVAGLPVALILVYFLALLISGGK